MPSAPVATLSPQVDRFLNGLVDAKVLDSGRARSAREAFENEGAAPDVEALAEFLIGRGLLTGYQAERALAGEADKLLLGPYLLLEPLKAGHLGAVYLALHRGDRRRFAVKVLPLRSLWKLLQAKKQASLFQSLPAHSAIVPPAEIDTANGSHFLGWPFIEGETVEAMLTRSGPMPAKGVCRLFSDVAEGLAICHEAGLFHGLLNPGNIMVGIDGKPRILDLGIGAILAENTDDDSVLDTISSANSALDMMDYCAPETIADPAARNPAADAYSFGCTLYAAFAGVRPFPDGSVVDKMIAHQTRMPTPLREIDSAIPEAVSDLVEYLMDKVPGARPSLGDAKAALDGIAQILPDDAPSTVAIGKLTLGFAEIRYLLAKGSAPESPPDEPVAAPQTHPIRYPSDGLIDFDVPGTVYGSNAPSGRRSSSGTGRVPLKSALAATAAVVDSGASVPELLMPPEGGYRTLTLANPVQGPVKPMPAIPIPKKNWKPLPAPVNWAAAPTGDARPTERSPVVVPPPPRFETTLAKNLSRQVLFWKAAEDTVQLSLFGAPEVAPGQRVNFIVYAHAPDVFSNVVTLCRAMRPDAELIGAGFLDVPVRRGADVSLHMALTHAGVAKSLVKFTWVGQTQPRTFEVFVPWESPAGLTSGVVTAGIEKTMVASVPLHFMIPNRTM